MVLFVRVWSHIAMRTVEWAEAREWWIPELTDLWFELKADLSQGDAATRAKTIWRRLCKVAEDFADVCVPFAQRFAAYTVNATMYLEAQGRVFGQKGVEKASRFIMSQLANDENASTNGSAIVRSASIEGLVETFDSAVDWRQRSKGGKKTQQQQQRQEAQQQGIKDQQTAGRTRSPTPGAKQSPAQDRGPGDQNTGQNSLTRKEKKAGSDNNAATQNNAEKPQDSGGGFWGMNFPRKDPPQQQSQQPKPQDTKMQGYKDKNQDEVAVAPSPSEAPQPSRSWLDDIFGSQADPWQQAQSWVQDVFNTNNRREDDDDDSDGGAKNTRKNDKKSAGNTGKSAGNAGKNAGNGGTAYSYMIGRGPAASPVGFGGPWLLPLQTFVTQVKFRVMFA
jgi:hypothetical protein